MRILILLSILAWLPTATAGQLQIALTNDDGWDAPGIQVLARELIQRGHGVILVGSATAQSGSGAALDGGPIQITKQAPHQYSAALAANEEAPVQGAEPLTCGMLAIEISTATKGRKPDLLLSGINSGANIGSAALHSGTVGAVLGALNRGIGGQLPGIAISTDEPKCDAACIDAHYSEVAGYVADLLDSVGSPAALLPPGIGLNINFPPRARAELLGTKIAVQDPGFGMGGSRAQLNFSCSACAQLQVGESAITGGIRPGADTGSTPKMSDVDAFNQGYVSIVPIAGDLTATNHRKLNRLLKKLAPR